MVREVRGHRPDRVAAPTQVEDRNEPASVVQVVAPLAVPPLPPTNIPSTAALDPAQLGLPAGVTPTAYLKGIEDLAREPPDRVAIAMRRWVNDCIALGPNPIMSEEIGDIVAKVGNSLDPRVVDAWIDLFTAQGFEHTAVMYVTYEQLGAGFDRKHRSRLLEAAGETAGALFIILKFPSQEERETCFARLRQMLPERYGCFANLDELQTLSMGWRHDPTDGENGARIVKLLEVLRHTGPEVMNKMLELQPIGIITHLGPAQLELVRHAAIDSTPLLRKMIARCDGEHLILLPDSMAIAFRNNRRPDDEHLDQAVVLAKQLGLSGHEGIAAARVRRADPDPPHGETLGEYYLSQMLWVSYAYDVGDRKPKPSHVEALEILGVGHDLDVMHLARIEGIVDKLEIVAEHAEQVKRIREGAAVVGDRLNVMVLLEAPDVERMLTVVSDSLTSLSSDQPEHTRLARLANLMSIRDSADRAHVEVEVVHDGRRRSWSQVTSAEREELLAGVVDLCLNPTSEAIERSNRRSFALASALSRNFNVHIPSGSHVHHTTVGALPHIVATANLAGELLGRLTGKQDSCPGFVDLQRLSPGVGPATYREIGPSNIYVGDLVLVYPFPSNADDFTAGHRGILGHQLRPAGMPNTELGLIIVKEDNESTRRLVTAAKSAAIERGLYTPIFSSEGRLLFSPTEFLEGCAALKRVDTLHQLIDAPDLHRPEFWSTPDPGGTQSIAAHMDEARDRTRTLLVAAGIGGALADAALVAARFHDEGKIDGGAQEVSNVQALGDVFSKVRFRQLEPERMVRLFVKFDELLGEVLKGTELSAGKVNVSQQARKKLREFVEVFTQPETRLAALALFQADTRSKGLSFYEGVEIEAKLRALGLPTFCFDDRTGGATLRPGAWPNATAIEP